MTRRYFIALFALTCFGPLAVAAGPDGLAPAGPASESEGVSFEEKVGSQVPLDIPFRDEKEQPITLRQAIDGKPTILVLVYYRCPKLCTEVLNDLLEAMRMMPPDYTAGQKFNVVTVSFDPKEHADLASMKKEAYLGQYGREGADWRFLTGSKESIKELTEAVGFKYEFDRAFKEYNHKSGIIVLTPEGKASRYFLGLGYKGETAYTIPDGTIPGGRKATTTLRLSLVEASNGTIGSVMDRFALACYRFDHTTKEYSLRVKRLVQVAGVLTLAVMAGGVFLALRSERRKRSFATAGDTATTLHTADEKSGGTN